MATSTRQGWQLDFRQIVNVMRNKPNLGTAALAAELFFCAVALRAECFPNYIRNCPCPAGCDQTLCQKICNLYGEVNGQCLYAGCGACTCGAYGMNSSPLPLRCVVEALNSFSFVSKVWASAPEKPAEPREVHTPLGDFVIVKPQDPSADNESGTVGLQIGTEGDRLLIRGVADGSPAAKAGLKKGQVILSIDSLSTSGMALASAARALRGKPGTMVVLGIGHGKKLLAKKIPLIRSTVSYASTPEAEKNKVRFNSVSLAGTGEKTCPSTHDGCYFLFLSDDKTNCTYACRAE